MTAFDQLAQRTDLWRRFRITMLIFWMPLVVIALASITITVIGNINVGSRTLILVGTALGSVLIIELIAHFFWAARSELFLIGIVANASKLSKRPRASRYIIIFFSFAALIELVAVIAEESAPSANYIFPIGGSHLVQIAIIFGAAYVINIFFEVVVLASRLRSHFFDYVTREWNAHTTLNHGAHQKKKNSGRNRAKVRDPDR